MDKILMEKFRLNMFSRRLIIDGKSIFLRNKEFALLEFFMKNMGKVLTRTEILERVWDRNIFCPTNTVDVHVSTLRKKIRRHMDGELIRTVHCVGYIFSEP